jgi:hypothetical protein
MKSLLFNRMIFYPLLALAAALLITLSLRPEWPPQPRISVAAERVGDALVFGVEALRQIDPGAEHVSHIARDEAGRPSGLRLARTMAALAGPNPDDPGASLALTAPDQDALAGRPVVIEIFYRPVAVSQADALAVGLDDGTTTLWADAPLAPHEGMLRLLLPAQAAPPQRLALRLQSARSDYNFGVELVEVRITPMT